MTLALHKPQRTLDQLRALAASGSSSFAKQAQRELRDRMSEALAASLASQREETEDGSARSQPCADAQERSPLPLVSDGGEG